MYNLGYTHYYETFKDISPIEWVNIRLDFFKVLPKFFDILDQTTGQKLEINDKNIFFNGRDEESHETFVLPIEKESNFCKTARKPYDLAVCTALIIAKHHLKGNIQVASDGDLGDWEEAMNLCQNILGYGAGFELDD